MKKELDSNTIAIEYLQGLLTSEEINDLQQSFNDTDISFEVKSYPPRVMAGIDELFSDIAIFLSSDVASGIFIGVISNGVFAALISCLKKIRNRFKVKKLPKANAGEITDKAPNVYIKIDNLNIQVPISAKDEEYEYFTEHVFESVKHQEFKMQTFCFFDEKTHSFIYKSILEIGQYEYQKHIERESIKHTKNDP